MSNLIVIPGNKEDINKIFTRGYSTKQGSRGIGMAIVKSNIDSIGGSITVESESGKGSTFTVIVPKKVRE